MIKLLNKGLNYAVLPQKLDIFEVLADFRHFERKMIWKEFFGNENELNTIPIFKLKKTNMPKNHTTPTALKAFLAAVRSEIMDPKNRNKEECNLPKDELLAMKTLMNLQKERQIIIQKCDKGAGLIILNFNDYMKACYEHLSANNNQGHNYYTQVQDIEL